MSEHDAEVRQAKQDYYAEVYRGCVHEIRRQIARGDHDGVWDTICGGPDAGGEFRLYPAGDRNIPYRLDGADIVGMCKALEGYALLNGWDQAVSLATRERLVAERRAKFATVAATLKRRARA